MRSRGYVLRDIVEEEHVSNFNIICYDEIHVCVNFNDGKIVRKYKWSFLFVCFGSLLLDDSMNLKVFYNLQNSYIGFTCHL